MTFKIISDSSSNLAKEHIEKYDVTIVPFYISLNGTDYLKEGVDISADEFYKKMRADNIFGKTSLPAIVDYTDAFIKHLESGLDILCICLSSELSGSYQSAVNASNLLKSEYPDREIIVIDSQLATTAQASFIVTAAELREKGESLQAVVEKLEASIAKSNAVFTVDTLDYLQHGGRIGKASAFAGTILNIKPLITFKDGMLVPLSKSRGRKKAIHDMIQAVINATGGDMSKFNFGVVHADCLEEATEVQTLLINEYNIIPAYPLLTLSVTIGVHTGPSLIGITYNHRADISF